MRSSVSFGLGFVCALLGVGIGNAAAYWVEAPANPMHRDYSTSQEYDNPTCPPKHEPVFRGIFLFQGQSSPIYDCVYNGNPETRVRWESLEQPTPTPEPS